MIKDRVKTLLETKEVDVFLGYRMCDGHPLPHCFVRERLEDVEGLVTGPFRYPLEKLAEKIAQAEPGIRIGILGRDCNQRALNVLSAWNRIDPGSIRTVELSCCPSPLKEHPECS
ncbi:MAG: hypothetical protein JW821_15210, partial [Deltaproteobacteria bacterium]|nr:hypothetical protein [Deltaproteobacteria bacterium]